MSCGQWRPNGFAPCLVAPAGRAGRLLWFAEWLGFCWVERALSFFLEGDSDVFFFFFNVPFW